MADAATPRPAPSAPPAPPCRTLVRATLNGVVWLVDPTSGRAYTCDTPRPTYMGQVEVPDGAPRLLSSQGAAVRLRPDWRAVMAALRPA
jgi:hypothetical protein